MTAYNNDPNANPIDEFFDMSDLENLDKQIEDAIGQPTLVDRMTERSDEESRKRLNWSKDLRQYWYVYVFLVISALFTGTLAIYMGLSPTLEANTDPLTGIINQSIHWNTDFGHIMLAIVYLITFIGVTEFQFALAKLKYQTREDSNFHQGWSMLVGLVVGFIGIIGTGIAGGSIVASNIAFMTEFQEIPPSAQLWVVRAIPTLLAIYAVLYTVYALSSGAAKAERVTSENKRKQNLDHETRMTAITQIAERKLQAAEINVYARLVMEGRMSRAEAMAAIRAGKTLHQTEIDLNRDLDDDNKIGYSAKGRPAPKTPPPLPPAGPPTAPEYTPWTLDQLLNALGLSITEAYTLMKDYGLTRPSQAFMELQKYRMLPPDLEYLNFANLYNELMLKGARANGAAVNP